MLMAVLKYQHAGARQREGMRLTQEETRARVHVELWTNEAIAYVDMDIPAARRALDKLRRALELYEVEHRD